MIKALTIGILISASLGGFAQDYDFKEPEHLKIKITTMDYFYKNPIVQGDTVAISDYDSKGNLIKTEHRYNGLIESNSHFKYDDNNRLIEYKDKGRRGYRTVTDPNTGDLVEESEYDGSIVLQTKKYKYDNYKLKQVDWYEFGDNLVISEIFDYNANGKIIKELMISYPNPNTLVYFKPNSSEIDWEHPRQESIETQTKTYSYIGDIRLGEYRDSTGLLSVDTTFFKDDLILRRVIYRTNGDKIFESFYDYDSDKKLLSYKTIDSGKSPFGGEYDFVASDNVKFLYDKNGYLITKEYFVDDKISTKIHYEYIFKK